MTIKETLFIKGVKTYCDQRIQEFSTIPTTRQEQLKSISRYISQQYKAHKTPQLIVICTHNSRRSHLGQIWLAIGADYFGLPKIASYSGGTEATAFNPRAVAALQRIGFEITTADFTIENPKYAIKWDDTETPYIAFSKKYDTPPNPLNNFAAIMVCTDADEKCPIIFGMDARFSLPFEDPKAFDNTALESQKYDERCEQIAREFLFIMSCVVKD